MFFSKQQKQVVLLYTTTVLGVLAGMLNSALNTRSLAPGLFGDVRYVQNLIAFVSSMLLVGYFVSGSRLLALSKSEEYSRRIRGIMCVILALTIGIVTLSMIIMCIVTGVMHSQSQMFSLYLAAIPFCGTTLMLNYVNTTAQGDNHIVRISIARLLPALLYFIIAFFIYKYFGATSVRMLLLFNGTSFVVLMAVILSTHPSFKGLKESFAILNAENKSYGLNVYIGSLASVSTGYIAGITLGQFADDNTNVGFFTLAQNLSSPLALLPSIIGTTYFKRFASENKISKKVLLSTIGLTVGSCLLFVILVKFVVMILYNESYYCVATYAAVLVVGTCMYGLGDVFNRFLGAHGRGKEIRNSAFACGSVLVVGSLVLVYFFQIDGAIITRILSSAVYLSFVCYYYIQFVRKQKLIKAND